MYPAIDLDDQPPFGAIKIDPIGSDSKLPAELESGGTAISEPLLQQSLCRRHLFSEP